MEVEFGPIRFYQLSCNRMSCMDRYVPIGSFPEHPPQVSSRGPFRFRTLLPVVFMNGSMGTLVPWGNAGKQLLDFLKSRFKHMDPVSEQVALLYF